MTLVVVFRRKVRERSELLFGSDSRISRFELVFGSDSRLSGGQYFDHAQKIFQLPRNDALFAFAGGTEYAYPLLMQMLRSIESFPPSADGRLVLSKAKGHILRVFQQSYSSIHNLPRNQKYPEDPDNYFLLGGYNWVTSDFNTWVLRFDATNRRFVFSKVTRTNSFYFISDNQDARSYAIAETNRLLRSRGKTTAEINYEPLEILGKIISDASFSTIGGAPQVGKVYPYLRTQLFQVKWPRAGSSIEALHIAGRPLLPTEKCSWPVFDLDRGFYVPRQRIVAEEAGENEEDAGEDGDLALSSQ
jgi:hypothetical protein